MMLPESIIRQHPVMAAFTLLVQQDRVKVLYCHPDRHIAEQIDCNRKILTYESLLNLSTIISKHPPLSSVN